jgi:hypothetical protein
VKNKGEYMKKVDVDNRIKYLTEEIQTLKQVRKTIIEDDKSLYGDISRIVERHLHADNPANSATRSTIFDPIMKDVKALLDKQKTRQRKIKEVA